MCFVKLVLGSQDPNRMNVLHNRITIGREDVTWVMADMFRWCHSHLSHFFYIIHQAGVCCDKGHVGLQSHEFFDETSWWLKNHIHYDWFIGAWIMSRKISFIFKMLVVLNCHFQLQVFIYINHCGEAVSPSLHSSSNNKFWLVTNVQEENLRLARAWQDDLTLTSFDRSVLSFSKRIWWQASKLSIHKLFFSILPGRFGILQENQAEQNSVQEFSEQCSMFSI